MGARTVPESACPYRLAPSLLSKCTPDAMVGFFHAPVHTFQQARAAPCAIAQVFLFVFL